MFGPFVYRQAQLVALSALIWVDELSYCPAGWLRCRTMSRGFLKSSLALWKRRLAYRQRRVRVSVRHHRTNSARKWRRLAAEAEKMVTRREEQLANAKPLRVRALNVMLQWVKEDVTEKGGNNRGPVVDAIIRKAGGTPGEPWCGDAVAAAYITVGSRIAKATPRKFAYVPYMRFLPRVLGPLPGHVVGYDFEGDGTEDHTGLFHSWIDRKAGRFLAAEGNTGTGGARSDGTGDGVHLRERNVSQVAWFRRVTA